MPVGNSPQASERRGHVALAGGSGFIGRTLAAFLVGGGYDAVILTRRSGGGDSRCRQVAWDDRTLGQ